VLRYRVNYRLRRLTLGPYPELSLHDARRKGREVLGDVARGDDPAQDTRERRDAEHSEKRHRSWQEAARIINKDLLPEFGHRLLVDIRRRDVREHAEPIARTRDASIMVNRTLAVLSCMFNYALDREWIEANPAARIPSPGEERSRDRVLNDDELRELWAALQSLADREEESDEAQELHRAKARVTPATAAAFQMQLVTAQRLAKCGGCGGPTSISTTAGRQFPARLPKTRRRIVCR
jgi:integrase